jgi:hypothetical protein
MILLFDKSYCVVGSLLGECLVVVLVLLDFHQEEMEAKNVDGPNNQ